MTAERFLHAHGQSPYDIDTAEAMAQLSQSARMGLEGKGGLPMVPSYLRDDISAPREGVCAVLDAGGTNLRTALARFENGRCVIEKVRTVPMPASGGVTLTADELYGSIANELRRLGHFTKVGCCFSYLVDVERSLDGRLRNWCKEIRSPDSLGKYVGKSLSDALGGGCEVAVLNDSTAALLGAKAKLGGEALPFVGIIMGTGINICYSEACHNIPKLGGEGLRGRMIISTEAGEFDGVAPGDFERQIIDGTDIPNEAQAEKQCSGAYLAPIIGAALAAAAAEGIIARPPREFSLADVSALLAGEANAITASVEADDLPFVRDLCSLSIERAAVIGALLCAEFVIRAADEGRRVRIAAEGSMFWKMHGFADMFSQKLAELLAPMGISFTLERADNPCLEGAALAAFAPRM